MNLAPSAVPGINTGRNREGDRLSTCSVACSRRLEPLRLIWDGQEHCICELMRELGTRQSRMSRHMSTLTVGRVGFAVTKVEGTA